MISLASGVVVHKILLISLSLNWTPHFISFHLLSLQLYLTLADPFSLTSPGLQVSLYINRLPPPLLLFLFLFLFVSPWANLWIHPSLRHQYSMWESRKGLQAPISFAPHYSLLTYYPSFLQNLGRSNPLSLKAFQPYDDTNHRGDIEN